jgi:hypothetical protein
MPSLTRRLSPHSTTTPHSTIFQAFISYGEAMLIAQPHGLKFHAFRVGILQLRK